jgi:hypothetical protein
MHTTTASEWAEMVSLAVALYAAASVPYFLLVDADLKDFDPRPALARTTNPVWQTAVNAGNDLNWATASGQHYVREFVTDVRSFARLSLRDSAFTATALLALLVPAPSESAR